MMATPTAMSPQEGLPAWARQLSEKYYSRTFSLFVLHGNVRDLVPVKRGTSLEFVPLPAFLEQYLFGQRDVVVHYDRGSGLKFATSAMQSDFRNALAGYDAFHGTDYAHA